MSCDSLKKLDRNELLQAQGHASRLVHDLGKQLTRAAGNFPEGEIPQPLVEMMIKDLFCLKGQRTALQVFVELAAPLKRCIDDSRLERIRALLEEIDRLESLIRVGDQATLRRAASTAIEIASLLRCIAEEINEACR